MKQQLNILALENILLANLNDAENDWNCYMSGDYI